MLEIQPQSKLDKAALVGRNAIWVHSALPDNRERRGIGPVPEILRAAALHVVVGVVQQVVGLAAELQAVALGNLERLPDCEVDEISSRPTEGVAVNHVCRPTAVLTG